MNKYLVKRDGNNFTWQESVDMLNHIQVGSRDDAVRVGFAFYDAITESGEVPFITWAKLNLPNKTTNDIQSMWKSLKRKGGIKAGTLYHYAYANGFRFRNEYVSPKTMEMIKREHDEIIKKNEAIKAENERKEQDVAKAAAQSALRAWNNAKPCSSHPYLTKKGVKPHGIRVNYNGNLVIPIVSLSGNVLSTQTILKEKITKDDGTVIEKMYRGGAKKSGGCYKLGEVTDTVLLCEGFATGASLYEATGLHTLVCFDASGLVGVARVVREHYPNHHIVVCADNDAHNDKFINTGIKSAYKAAMACDADVVYPRFKSNDGEPTDFNDLGDHDLIRAVVSKPTQVIFTEVPNDEKRLDEHGKFEFYQAKIGSESELRKALDTCKAEMNLPIAAFSLALKMANKCPSFYSLAHIRKAINHPRIRLADKIEIMKFVQYKVTEQMEDCQSAFKLINNKEILGKDVTVNVLPSLECAKIVPNAINLVCSGMGTGKTKNVISSAIRASEKAVFIAPRVSLIDDASNKLKIQKYTDRASSDVADKMAICIASIASNANEIFMNQNGLNVVVDEYTQCLSFLSADICKTKGKKPSDVYWMLRNSMIDGNTTIACDASINNFSMSFINTTAKAAHEQTKQVHLHYVPPVLQDRTCYMYESKETVVSIVEKELAKGGKVWLACDSKATIDTVFNLISGLNDGKYKCLKATSETKSNADFEAFVNDVNGESRKYDIVLASPCITSGVSIEHANNPHFTMIAGIAGGNSVTFTDFAQMLGRVRYVKDYHVYIKSSHVVGGRDFDESKESLEALESLLCGYDNNIGASIYDLHKIHNDRLDRLYRHNMANGLYYFLEHAGFNLELVKLSENTDSIAHAIKAESKAVTAKNVSMIIDAKPLTIAEYNELSVKRKKTDVEIAQTKAFKIRKLFNIAADEPISEINIEMYAVKSKLYNTAAIMGKIVAYEDKESINGFAKEVSEIDQTHAKQKAIHDIFGKFYNKEFKMDDLMDHIKENRNIKKYVKSEFINIPALADAKKLANAANSIVSKWIKNNTGIELKKTKVDRVKGIKTCHFMMSVNQECLNHINMMFKA